MQWPKRTVEVLVIGTTVPMTDPIVVRDVVSPWAFVAVGVFAATATVAGLAVTRRLRSTRARHGTGSRREAEPLRTGRKEQ